jgi:hypothetical protein
MRLVGAHESGGRRLVRAHKSGGRRRRMSQVGGASSMLRNQARGDIRDSGIERREVTGNPWEIWIQPKKPYPV